MKVPSHAELVDELLFARAVLRDKAQREVDAGTPMGRAIVKCLEAMRRAIRQGRYVTYMKFSGEKIDSVELLYLLSGCGIKASYDGMGHINLKLEW